MSKFTCLIVCVVGVCVSNVFAFTPEERKAIHDGTAPVVTECAKQHGVTPEEFEAAQKSDNYEKHYCFLACAMKKAGILTEKGLYNTNSPLGVLKTILSDESYASYEVKGNKCISVNDKAVSDGEAGCDRAKLVKECFDKNGIELVL